jgi:site-specific recombinase XerD
MVEVPIGGSTMFDELFKSRAVVSRHRNAPLSAEREQFLRQRQQEGRAPVTILRLARELLCVVTMLEILPSGVTAKQISSAADQWARKQQKRGRAKTDKWSKHLFISVATDWCRFLGYFCEEVPVEKPQAFASEILDFAEWMQSERGLSPSTIVHYSWYIKDFLRWCEERGWRPFETRPNHIDEYLSERSIAGWSRVSGAKAAMALRGFFRHAHRRGWCQVSIADAIQGPRIYRLEGLPSGPAWTDVIRLIESMDTNEPLDIRDRAIVMLCATYGLRSGEVRQLRLDDIDWDGSKISIWRPKQRRRQNYPLVPTVGHSIIQYLSAARPKTLLRELFLTTRSPFHPLSACTIYQAVSKRYTKLGVTSRNRGPHSLRHACATHLVECGLSFKEIGDHLGHRSTLATQIYAKVDLQSLRLVAALSVRGVI